MAWNQKRLSEVITQHEAWLLDQAGIVGAGVALDAKGQLCIEVLTDAVSAETRRSVERRLSGVPLTFTDTGPISAT